MRASTVFFTTALLVGMGGGAMAQTPEAPPPAPPAQPPPAPPGYAQPQPGYEQPPPGYGQPPPGYGQPPPGYGQPPPGYGQPPPGYGEPPPGYGQAPQGYYYPPPGYYPGGYQSPQIGPSRLDYVEGQPIPPGYRVETRARRGLVLAGLITFGSPYVVSALTAGAFLSEGNNSSSEFAPLLIPAAGPFITIGTARSEGAGTFMLVLDGIAQTGGLAMLITGIAAQEQVLLRNDVAKASPRPEVLLGPQSGTLRWRF